MEEKRMKSVRTDFSSSSSSSFLRSKGGCSSVRSCARTTASSSSSSSRSSRSSRRKAKAKKAADPSIDLVDDSDEVSDEVSDEDDSDFACPEPAGKSATRKRGKVRKRGKATGLQSPAVQQPPQNRAKATQETETRTALEAQAAERGAGSVFGADCPICRRGHRRKRHAGRRKSKREDVEAPTNDSRAFSDVEEDKEDKGSKGGKGGKQPAQQKNKTKEDDNDDDEDEVVEEDFMN